MPSPLPLSVFPDCHGCRNFLTGPARTCLACARRSVTEPGEAACLVCAQRLGAGGSCPNELCRNPRRRIARIRAIGYQAGPLRQCIYGYKYRGTRTWSIVLGRLLLAWLDEHQAADRPGLIVANPSFVGPAGQAFAHTEAVLAAAAEADAAQAGTAGAGDGRAEPWPFDTARPAAIIKTRPTLKSADAQAWLKRVTGDELRAALAVPDPARTAGKFIVVYDDVATTGTQLDAVAGCLLDQGGAARVEGVVLARAPWRA